MRVMQRDTLLLLLGVFVFATPFLGVPEVWRAWFLGLVGGCIVLVALAYRFDARRRSRDTSLHAAYRDVRPEQGEGEDVR